MEVCKYFKWHPAIELPWLAGTNFFPPKPVDISKIKSICLGTKTRTIGDALILTTLPRKLITKNPEIKIYVYPRAFNPITFTGNPYVRGLKRFPKALFGDDANYGGGHHIQVKESFFDLPISEKPRPQIYLSDNERSFASKYILKNSRSNLPICMLHPHGHTWAAKESQDFWSELISLGKHRFQFWQIGLINHPKLPNCDHYFFLKPAFSEARKLFSVMEKAKAFIGVNSGPMHVARSFDIRSLILTYQGSTKELFHNRNNFPYFLKTNYIGGFLYEQNHHLEADLLKPADLLAACSNFLAGAF